MNIFRKARLIIEFLGPGWVAYRLGYALRRRLGLLRRASPQIPWDAIPAGAKLPDWLRAPAWPASGMEWGDQCVTEADGISLGEFILFSGHAKHLGVPPNWHRNPFTGQSAPRGRHWSDLGDFDFGDIKTIWEPSRFGWAFTLVRAHARTGEARFAELFWTLFEDWCAQNPPNEGVNWKCGQEATFRLMAVTFAVAEFGRLPSATEERLLLWSRFVTATGRRIQANLDYALSQSNNHGVSECVGLITVGLLSTDSDESRGWRDLGLRQLEGQVAELIYADGGFSQHSMNYHRVLLHDLIWAVRLIQLSGGQVPGWLDRKLRMALLFVQYLWEPSSGRLPLTGSNDGADILPLDECAYDDFRGVIQGGWAVLENRLVLPPGLWSESAFWLSGRDPAGMSTEDEGGGDRWRWHAAESGHLYWRSGETRLNLRCPVHFRHRPDHADMLHIDVTWRSIPVAHDSGSYSYNTSGVFDGALQLAKAHNVMMLADREPMEKASRFLYLPWPKGSAHWSESDRCFRGSHDAYGADAKIERAITAPEGGDLSITRGIFSITDTIILRLPGRVRLHWLLADAGWKLDQASRTLSANLDGLAFVISWQSSLPAAALSLVRADPNSARGWWSRHYLELEPAVSFELLFDVEKELTVTTRFAPGR